MAIILYARKSVERENSISCETQLDYCRSAVRPEERQEKLLTFVDNGFSGGNTDRDGFQEMMKLVRQGSVSKVIVYKLDRISRSLADFVNILQEFKAHGVEFVSSQESFDTSSPYGELIVKILMVFAEFERTSTINRVTQAYAHRSEMGFYMGGRRPYGFELVPAVIHNITTRKLQSVPSEAEQVRRIFETYARENISLRSLADILEKEEGNPSGRSGWSASGLSALLRNPIYVKADSYVYDYYDRRGVRMINDLSLFIGKYGAQLYGRTRHRPENPDWSDMKLVLLTHEGTVSSDIWLRCQQKLERNRRITNSCSNRTSWLAGRVVCAKCGHTMTTVKGKQNKNGQIRRYFNCTGKSHKKICTGTEETVYAEDLERMVCDCIAVKLSGLRRAVHMMAPEEAAGLNELKLKINAIQKKEKQLMDTILTGSLNDDLLMLANQEAARLEKDRHALEGRMEALKHRESTEGIAFDPLPHWERADYDRKKEVALIMIHKILVDGDGSIKIIWNI